MLAAAFALAFLPAGCTDDETPSLSLSVPEPTPDPDPDPEPEPEPDPDPDPEPDPGPVPDPTNDPDYESTDYSADGEVVVLQRASEGRGIDIVLMGDAYTDRMVANGVYMHKMRQAAEAFFSEEPYRSLRRLFNVYAVKVVSPHEVIADGRTTALGVSFGEGTLIFGDHSAVAAYAQCVPELCGDADRLDELTVVVIVNQIRWAGTCHPWGPFSVADGTVLEGDYGRGFAITYSTCLDEEDLIYTVVHEASGHGFAKLADEYYDYESEEYIPDGARTSEIWYQQFGYWRNVDFSGDAAQCAWACYLNDPRYAGCDVGYYEGGDYYARGVWRSSWQSLMLYTEGGFNPISRETIYRRIHKLAYGDGWEFDYETFAAFDAPNRRRTAARVLRPQPADRPPLPAPQWLDRTRPLL